MKILLETTEWTNGTPNHVYALEKDKMIAYKAASGLMQRFSRPMWFDKKGRTFKEIADEEFEEFLQLGVDKAIE